MYKVWFFFQCWFLWRGFLFLCTWVNWSAVMTRLLGMNHSVADPRPLKLPIGHLLAPGWLWLSGYWQPGSKQSSRPGLVCDCRRWTAEWSSNWPGLLTPGRTGEVEFFQLKSGVVTDYLLLFPYTASKIWEPMVSKILLKNNGRHEIFEKKIHGKEVTLPDNRSNFTQGSFKELP